MTLRPCQTCGAPFAPRHRRHLHCAEHEPHGNAHRSPTTRARRDGTGDYERNRRHVLERDSWQCVYCGQPATTVDHVIPVARGGGHDLTNLVAACATCNFSKRAAAPDRPAAPDPSLVRAPRTTMTRLA
jgi:5-methylcytosine-specific restriction endonuclease McrA